MGFEIVPPPKENEDDIAEASKEILAAAAKLGDEMEPRGFIYSWISGTRVVVNKDEKGEIVGLCLFTAGRRWSSNDDTAHILRRDGKMEGVIDFVKTMCLAIGVSSLYYEEDDVLEEGDGFRRYVIREVKLQ